MDNEVKKNRKSQVLVLIIVGVLLVLTLLAYLYFSKEKEQTEINESLIGKENLSGELLPYIINLNNTKLVADIYMDEGSMRFGALLKFKITEIGRASCRERV